MLPLPVRGEKMKIRHSVTALLLAAAVVFGLTACGSRNDDVKNVSKPKTTATGDEVYTVPSDAVEESANVNGMRFNLSLYQFTANYNNERTSHGDKDILDLKKWEKNGESEKDGNGVYVQYWHYDEDDVSLTATVEVKSDKLVNIGCGTTMSNFMEMTGDVNNSDKILEKTAQMAQAACGFPAESEGTLQDIFYRTTTGSDDSLWYSGYVFSLSTKKDEKDSKNNIMLFRVFPVTEELKTEWNLKEYTK